MALSLVATAALAHPVPADAGTYTVWSCERPGVGTPGGGLSAPPGDGTYGWVGDASGHGTSSGCGGSVDNQSPYVGEYARARFVAPPGTTIASWTLGYGGYARPQDPSTQAGGEVVVREGSLVRDRASGTGGNGFFPSQDPSNTAARVPVSNPVASGGQLSVTAACAGPAGALCVAHDVVPWTALFRLRSEITLLDGSPPTGSAAGDATSDAVWTGTKILNYAAADTGGGIYRLVVLSDGQEAQSVPAPDNGRRCADADPNMAGRQFLYPLPCLASTVGQASIDTTTLLQGSHQISVLAEDAAGNRTPIYGPATKDVVNDFRARGFYVAGHFFNPRKTVPRTINGRNGGEGAELDVYFARKRRVPSVTTASYHQRLRVRGRLETAAGEPIAGAVLFRAVRTRDHDWRLEGALTTTKHGSISYLEPARRPTRDLKLVYFPYSDSDLNGQSNQLTARIRAGVSLNVSRRHATNGQRVIFTGVVHGAIPANGVAASVQAKVGRRYQTFRTIRVLPGRRGRFRTAYRFRRTTGRIRYRFRIVILKQAGLPYETGRSPTRTVTVTP